MPLSWVAPLNGNVELRWGGASGLGGRGSTLGGRADAPCAERPERRADPGRWHAGLGGRAHVRAGYCVDARLLFTVVFENVSDAAYRVHGFEHQRTRARRAGRSGGGAVKTLIRGALCLSFSLLGCETADPVATPLEVGP